VMLIRDWVNGGVWHSELGAGDLVMLEDCRVNRGEKADDVQLAQQMAKGQPIAGVSWDDVHAMNAGHAKDNANVTKQEAIDLLRQNSAAAAAAIRALTAEQLATATPNSLYEDAPLTCQFFIEDHALRHSYHHMVLIRRALGR